MVLRNQKVANEKIRAETSGLGPAVVAASAQVGRLHADRVMIEGGV